MFRRVHESLELIGLVELRVAEGVDRPEVERIVPLEGERDWIEVQVKCPAETCVLLHVWPVRNVELQGMLHI